ncbi:MAG: hypothetical protein HYX33_00565 [Actinobacteria bacterium]|nr:hypothetical protein [Actinomycetota bacterium]
MIPFGPTNGEKDGSWRGGSALIGVWLIFWFFGLFPKIPQIVFSGGFWQSFLLALALLGIIMSFPYAWQWVRGRPPSTRNGNTQVLYQGTDASGQDVVVYHPEVKAGSWAAPLNKGSTRNLSTRMTIWREFTWVAPVTVGDLALTSAWNIVLILLGRSGRLGGSRRRRSGRQRVVRVSSNTSRNPPRGE